MKKLTTRLAILPLVVSSMAHAEINLNGFATIVGGMTTDSDETLYNYDDSFDFKNDSLLAVQVSSDLGEGLGVTAQIISRGIDDWEPAFEWAYISYDVSEQWRMLIGRQRAPQKLYSDYVDVGYAYPWISPPKGLYSASFDSFDGIGSIYNFTMSEWESTFHVLYGRSQDNPFGDTVNRIDIKDYLIATLTITDSVYTARVGLGRRDLDVDITNVNRDLAPAWYALAQHPQLSQTGIDFTAIGDSIVIDDSSTVATAAFRAEYDAGFVVLEWERNDYGDNFLGEADSWYISAGINADSWVYHITYGVNENDVDNVTLPNQAAGLGLDELIAGTVATFSSQIIEEDYYTIGARYDFHPSAAFKIEYTKLNDKLNNPFTATADAGVVRFALVTLF